MAKIRSNSFLLFWSLLGLGGLIIIWFLPWRFQTNDDELMMWLVSGAYTGTPESYAVFIHPILSWIFAKFYTFFPSIPWYPLTWFGVLFGSYSAIILSLTLSQLDLNRRNLTALFSLLLFLHFGLFPQFTIVSGVAALSGLLLLVTRSSRKSSFLYLYGLVLIVISTLIRWESTILILLGFSFYWVCFYYSAKTRITVKAFLPPILIILVLVVFKIRWEKQAAYAEFVHYSHARASVSDHPVSYRLISEEQLSQSSPWFFFSQWMMEDDQLGVEELQNRKAKLDSEFYSLDQAANSLERLFSVMKEEAFKSVFSFLLFFYYLFTFKSSKKHLVFIGSWALFFLGFNHFYILNGRVDSQVIFLVPF